MPQIMGRDGEAALCTKILFFRGVAITSSDCTSGPIPASSGVPLRRWHEPAYRQYRPPSVSSHKKATVSMQETNKDDTHHRMAILASSNKKATVSIQTTNKGEMHQGMPIFPAEARNQRDWPVCSSIRRIASHLNHRPRPRRPDDNNKLTAQHIMANSQK